MAYTYADFQKAASDAGLTGSFDESDLNLAVKYPEYGLSLVSLRRDLGNAQTNEQRLLAAEAENQLRKNYGQYGVGQTSGDMTYATSYGSRIGKALDDVGNYGSFNYGRESDYQNLLDRVINQKSFDYDYQNDPIYSSYKKAYNREGDRAAANALGQAAAATGGRASSYAQTASQQAGNYYAGQLADIIPQLRSQALSEYNSEYQNLLQALAAQTTDRNTAYNEWQDQYNMLQQNLKNLQGQDDTDYQRFLDQLNAEYQRERDVVADTQQAWDNAIQVYQLTGKITGPLADYLGVESQATGTGAGGGVGGGDGFVYTGSARKITSTENEDADAILAKYTGYIDSDGSWHVPIGSWADYQKLKELTGYSDADLNSIGVEYGYPTTTDANGNLTPATAYTTQNGQAVTWEQYDTTGGTYADKLAALETMRQSGASKDDVLGTIRTWYMNGSVTPTDYQRMYGKYRELNANTDYGATYQATYAAEQKAKADAAAKAAAQSSTPISYNSSGQSQPSNWQPTTDMSWSGTRWTSNTSTTGHDQATRDYTQDSSATRTGGRSAR